LRRRVGERVMAAARSHVRASRATARGHQGHEEDRTDADTCIQTACLEITCQSTRAEVWTDPDLRAL
jgi:hypothetical protein